MTRRVACIRFQFCQECHGFLVTWDHHILLGTLMLSSWGRVNNLSHSLCAQCSPRYGPMRNCTYSYLRSSRILNLGNMKPLCGNFAKIRILERLCTNLAFFSTRRSSRKAATDLDRFPLSFLRAFKKGRKGTGYYSTLV